MSTSSKPLTYLSAECVLQYMDPHIRFRLSQHCPGLQSLEKRVPLKVGYLKLSEYEFTVNETRYRLGIVQDYPEDQAIPEDVQRRNENGGVQYDLDKYGLRRDPTPMDLVPGDLVFKDDESPHEGHEPTLAELEAKVKKYEKELRARDDPNWSSSPNYEHTPENYTYPSSSPTYGYSDSDASPAPSPTYSNCEAVSNPGNYTEEELLEKITLLELLPHELRRDGLEPTWKLFFQVTIYKKCDIIGIHRVRYGPSCSIARAMKHLYQNILGDRRPIQVHRFELAWQYYDMVLRLPASLKLKIDRLWLTGKSDKSFEVLEPIICESSLPFQAVLAQGLPQHSWIKTARTLVLIPCFYRTLPTTEYFLSLENQMMQMTISFTRFTVADCIPIVQNWLETRKEVGTCYEFEMRRVDENVLVGMANRFNGSYRDGTVKIPLDNRSELQISSKYHENLSEYTLTMEVVNVENGK